MEELFTEDKLEGHSYWGQWKFRYYKSPLENK